MDDLTKIKFSIIIPVYNTEAYLDECIQSAINQTYRNYEIILVDDGSTDNSGEICRKYAAEYEQIVAYHTENKGQMHARQFGIQRATGDYDVFLDSDDTLCLNALQVFATTIDKHQCDCVIFRVAGMRKGQVNTICGIDEEIVITDKRELYRKCLFVNMYNSMCKKVIKASLLRGNDPMPDSYHVRMGEDLLQSLAVYQNSHKITFIGDVLYKYRDNAASITHTYRHKNFEDSITVRMKVLEFLKNEKVFSRRDFADYRQACVIIYIQEMLNVCSHNISVKEKVRTLKKAKKTAYFCDFLNHDVNKMAIPLKQKMLFNLHKWNLNYFIAWGTSVYLKLQGKVK